MMVTGSCGQGQNLRRIKAEGRARRQPCLRMAAVPQWPPKAAPGDKKMDVRTSRYTQVYAHWQRNPEVFWAEAA
ncbi:MAG TPA: hypothetical protein VG986_03930, partial [Pseudolabrys sp.]|nr:hypothetical protein [Pseudolabrys sp.]